MCVRVSKSAHRGSNAGLAKSPGLEVFNSDSKPFVESMYPLSDIATSVPNSFWYVDQNFSRGCLPQCCPRVALIRLALLGIHISLWPIMGPPERGNEYQHRSEWDNSSIIGFNFSHPQDPNDPNLIQRHVTGSVTTCLTDPFWPIPQGDTVSSYEDSKRGIHGTYLNGMIGKH